MMAEIAHCRYLGTARVIIWLYDDCCVVWQVIPAWLSCLPIKGDLIEAKVVHELLCSMVERQVESYYLLFLILPSFLLPIVAHLCCVSNKLSSLYTGRTWSFWAPTISMSQKLFLYLPRLVVFHHSIFS